jgi:hypothetical protein
MTTQTKTDLTAKQVADFLSHNPSFFLEHENLLADIFLPHESGNAVSLLERQVKILRERNIDTRKRLADMLEQGQRNDVLFNKTRSLILNMLDSKSLSDLSKRISEYCQQEFQVDSALFTLFASDNTPHANACRVISSIDAEKTMPGLLTSTECISGSFRPEEIRFLFSDPQVELASAIVLPIHINDQISGMLALGSDDPHYFKAGMDTLFLKFIGDVITHLVPQFTKKTT